MRWAASETLVDEGYHVLMVVNAMRACKAFRKLESIRLGRFQLTRMMNQEVSQADEDWKKMIVKLVTSIVSEVFISDYLSLISEARSIQPLNRYTTDTHKKDEMAHSGIFRTFTKEIYFNLNGKQQRYFSETIAKHIKWFASKELDIWSEILTFIDFPNAEEIINDCRSTGESDLSRVDYSELIELSEEVGILDSTEGREAFERENII